MKWSDKKNSQHETHCSCGSCFVARVLQWVMISVTWKCCRVKCPRFRGHEALVSDDSCFVRFLCLGGRLHAFILGTLFSSFSCLLSVDMRHKRIVRCNFLGMCLKVLLPQQTMEALPCSYLSWALLFFLVPQSFRREVTRTSWSRINCNCRLKHAFHGMFFFVFTLFSTFSS